MKKKYLILRLRTKDITDRNMLFAKEEHQVLGTSPSEYLSLNSFDTLEEAETKLATILAEDYIFDYTIIPLYSSDL